MVSAPQRSCATICELNSLIRQLWQMVTALDELPFYWPFLSTAEFCDLPLSYMMFVIESEHLHKIQLEQLSITFCLAFHKPLPVLVDWVVHQESWLQESWLSVHCIISSSMNFFFFFYSNETESISENQRAHFCTFSCSIMMLSAITILEPISAETHNNYTCVQVNAWWRQELTHEVEVPGSLSGYHEETKETIRQ